MEPHATEPPGMLRGTNLPRSRRPGAVEVRTLSATGIEEVYVTAAPPPGLDPAAAARELYLSIRRRLAPLGGHVLSERLFAASDTIPLIEEIRGEVYGRPGSHLGEPLEDGVPPTRIVVSPDPIRGSFAGVQVHAVCEPARPRVFRCCDLAGGTPARLLESTGGRRWLFVNGLDAGNGVAPAEQARRMFFCTGCLLRQAGATMRSVARTWLWMRDICDWYGDFNAVRTSFFEREGLLGRDLRSTRFPASTGIGLPGASGAACTLDLVALPGSEEQIELVAAAGDQNSAFEYGSAFSRASVAPMPGGTTVFVSGTAAIDRTGLTEHVDRIDAQIDDTIAHVRSLLRELGCRDEDVLTALVYCKSAEVELAFQRRWPGLGWPRITMIGDVCRPELLFEVEVTASADADPPCA